MKHGPLFTLDAPVPRHNCTAILKNIFPIFQKRQSGKSSIIVIIKGFNPKYNQNQLENSLAELIFLHIVKLLIAEQDVDIIVDGVSRSSLSNLTFETNEAFSRFYLAEMEMYQKVILSLSDQDRARVTSIIGFPAKNKYSYYVNSGFSVSISAHSTQILSLMAGKQVIDILSKGVMKNIINNSIYYHARDLDPHGLAFISFDESDLEEDIIEYIELEMRKLLRDRSRFFLENSITTHHEKLTKGF